MLIATVALNDIGVASFYTNCHIVDLYGLANSEVLKEKQAGIYNTQQIQDILMGNNIDAAMLYRDWFMDYGGLPTPYYLRPVVAWTILEPNVVCGWNTVYMYAPAPKDQYLRTAAQLFEPNLPPTIEVDFAPAER